jgi:hypothetical protein
MLTTGVDVRALMRRVWTRGPAAFASDLVNEVWTNCSSGRFSGGIAHWWTDWLIGDVEGSGQRQAERLEPRTLMSGEIMSVVSVLDAGPHSGSSFGAIYVDDVSSSDGMESLAGATSGGSGDAASLTRLDKFRADPRFSWVNGSGFSSVIIDTGINPTHAFFGPDADKNGAADRIVYQYDFADNDASARDMNGHGSNVSSIIGSQNTRYSGVAPGTGIISLKVFTDAGAGSFSYVEKALQWVVANAGKYNIASVNMSLGDSKNYNSTQQLYGLSDELSKLAAMNVIVIGAAGNSFYEFKGAQGVAYPAADPNVIGVGAVYANASGGWTYGSGASTTSSGSDRITPFSQRSTTLTPIFAPGAPITGAAKDKALVTMHGTSQAAPFVTGAATLAQQMAMKLLGRRLTPAEFKSIISSTGATIVDGDDEVDNVTNTNQVFKRIDVMAMGESILSMGAVSASITPGPQFLSFGAAGVSESTLSGSFSMSLLGKKNLGLGETA